MDHPRGATALVRDDIQDPVRTAAESQGPSEPSEPSLNPPPASSPSATGGLAQVTVTDDLGLLLAVLPQSLREALEASPQHGDLLEVVLDLGRRPEARYADTVEDLSLESVDEAMLATVVGGVGTFGQDNRAGIERTLHRISALRNRVGDVVGLTCRVGRAVLGTVDIVQDVIEAGHSVLLLGRPGVGKTTLLREAARVLADELEKRVIVVDTSNEIAGDGDVPHPGIGRARRMQVPSPDRQHAVMIEAVENHMPEVIVIDEIGTEAEALAARTIAERGVQLIATAHGNTLENLLQNPTLADLIGGIHAVTLSDEEARRRNTQKTVLERKAPPTFDVVIEIQAKDRLAVHHGVAQVVDRLLRGASHQPELRQRRPDGQVEIEPAEHFPAERHLQERRSVPPPRPAPGASSASAPRAAPHSSPRSSRGDLATPRLAAQRILRIFPYAISRGKLERAIRDLRVPARVVHLLREADLVLTPKSQERRQPHRLRDAQLNGVRLEVVKSNTPKQIESFLRREFGVEAFSEEHEYALQQAENAIDQVLDQGHPVELGPQDSYIRRLQHELVDTSGLVTESKGKEPYRRVIVYPS